MPVQVGVSLLAAQGQQIGAFGGDDRLDRQGDSADRPHQPQVGVFVKVPDGMLHVGAGSHQDLAGHRGVAIQESDVVLVLEDDLLKVVAGRARQDGADEARTASGAPDVAGEIEGFSSLRQRIAVVGAHGRTISGP